MKRHPALQDLSRDHFQILVRCQAIRKAVQGGFDVAKWNDMARQFLAFVESDLHPHFEEEERFVLPLAARASGLSGIVANVRRAHEGLRAAFARLAAALSRGEGVEEILRAIEPELDAHVRYEEAELFEGLQKGSTDDSLRVMWREAYAYRKEHRSATACGVHPGPPA